MPTWNSFVKVRMYPKVHKNWGMFKNGTPRRDIGGNIEEQLPMEMSHFKRENYWTLQSISNCISIMTQVGDSSSNSCFLQWANHPQVLPVLGTGETRGIDPSSGTNTSPVDTARPSLSDPQINRNSFCHSLGVPQTRISDQSAPDIVLEAVIFSLRCCF